MTTTFATLKQRLSEGIGDWIEVDTTTNITTNTSVISTSLNQYDNGADDFFNSWYVLITEGNNINVERQISDYATATGTITVRGANLLAETGAVTIWVGRYSYSNKGKAINRAIEEVFPALHKKVDDITLIAGNYLPNSHFEDWASSSYPDKYAVTNATSAANTTAGNYRGGGKSSLVTASGADGYMYITSNDYPRLLDLMDQVIDFKCWVKPEVADDAFLTIYTVQADGTAQTLNSTTTCPSGKWALLELEQQTINDNIVEIQFRFRVHTNTRYAYFDNARVTGVTNNELVLPTKLQKGVVTQVYIQTSGGSDDMCDDIHPMYWDRIFSYDLVDDGTSEYLVLPTGYSKQLVRVVGLTPFTALSSSTDTIPIDEGGQTNMLVAYAAYKLFKMEGKPTNRETISDKVDESDYFGEYQRLLRKFGMTSPSGTMRV